MKPDIDKIKSKLNKFQRGQMSNHCAISIAVATTAGNPGRQTLGGVIEVFCYYSSIFVPIV